MHVFFLLMNDRSANAKKDCERMTFVHDHTFPHTNLHIPKFGLTHYAAKPTTAWIGLRGGQT